MPHRREKPRPCAAFPIESLRRGEIMPPLKPRHGTWDIAKGWNDPLAPWAGYRVQSSKSRIETEHGPAVEWAAGVNAERALLTGPGTWRDYSVSCRVQALQAWYGRSHDDNSPPGARAGLVLRADTSRRYYLFCLECQQRLVLYRRIDDEWFVLAAQRVPYAGQAVTLQAEVDGDSIRAACPELGVSFHATDTHIRSGKAGFRAAGHCRLFGLAVEMTPSQRKRNGQAARLAAARTKRLSESVPKAVKIAELDLSSGKSILACTDFCKEGRNDLLVRTARSTTARTWGGKRLWSLPERLSFVVEASQRRYDGGRRIYGVTGVRRTMTRSSVRGTASVSVVADELVAIDGVTGKVRARRKLPREKDLHLLRCFDISNETAPQRTDGELELVVRQWRADCGGGGRDLWAYDKDLKLLWHRKVDPPYGHHNAVHLLDVNGDGKTEVMAGGTLLSCDGETLAVHDRAHEMAKILSAQHYDAVVVGNFNDDPSQDPVAFLVGGSAGVYVIDPLTGRTRAVHRTGHAQWGMPCRVRDDMPGRQVLSGTRWGNYGIMTLFSGRGERLWTIQPDFIVQGTRPVQWLPGGPELIWHNTSEEAQGFYDGHGRLVSRLEPLRELWHGRTPMNTGSLVLRPNADGPDALAVTVEGKAHVFGPER